MKRILTILTLLLTLLPMMAQKPFKLRVVPGKDYPYYIYSINARVEERNVEKNLYDIKESGMQRDGKSFCATFDTKRNGKVILKIYLADPQNEMKAAAWCFIEFPLIAGEELTITLHDFLDHEFTGSRIYREYGQAFKAVCRNHTPLKDYVAKHRKEPGCALFAISSILEGNSRGGFESNSLKAMFDSTTYNFLAKDEWGVSEILCFINGEMKNNHSLYPDLFPDLINARNNSASSSLHQFDRDLEGQTIIDTIAARYKGKPTLVCISTFGGYSTDEPDGYELLMHAMGMNQVFLTSLKEDMRTSPEQRWKQRFKNSFTYPGDHHLMMRYQVDSLFNLYMPHATYPVPHFRCFYLLLDASGKVVAKGDRQHDYAQLIATADRLKAQAGLPPFKGEPFKQLTYLDLADPYAAKFSTKEYETLQLTRRRMTYTELVRDEDIERRYTRTLVYDVPYSRSLGISRRLYDWVKKDAKNRTEQSYQSMLSRVEQMGKQQDDYQPDIASHRQDITVGNAVDLGLSVKWADMNIGAKTAEETGYYFTWADVEPIKIDSVNGRLNRRGWDNYRWCKGDATTLRKYNTKSENGPVDMRTTILPEDDAAVQFWQGDWRMPTKEEMDELIEKCQWEWTLVKNVMGYKVTGPNGNHIFMPAAGCLNYQGNYGKNELGYYWTSSLNQEKPNECYYNVFRYEKKEIWSQDRFAGRCIRAVADPPTL